ncbi:unnamed protein product [Pedinophyceae sp. YPF-701]|nr:unnamed protein product [Pedinophyceae sp. YPF-701]
MASNVGPVPLPRRLEALGSTPGPRCGHVLTAVMGPGGDLTTAKLVLFGGATALEGSARGDAASPATPGPNSAGAGIRLAGATNDIHIFDVATGEWTKVTPDGEAPSARAAHAAAAVGNMVVVQGGIGPHGLADNDLHVLDFSTPSRPKWHRVVVQGPAPGPRYAHTLSLVLNRFLVIMGGNDGRSTLSDCWALDTSEKPYQWQKVAVPDKQPAGRMYAAAVPRQDGLMLLCGGRDASGVPLGDAYGLSRHRDGRWEWAEAPAQMPAGRYQHAAVFVDGRLHVVGGAVGGGRMVDAASSALVFDSRVGVWQAHDAGADELIDLTRRCRHAVAAVGPLVFVYGGLRGSTLLEDLLVADDSAGMDPIVRELRAKSDLWGRFLADGTAGSAVLQDFAAEEAARVWQVQSESSGGPQGSGGRGSASAGRRGTPAGRAGRGNDHGLPPMTPDVRLYHRAAVVAHQPDMRGLIRDLSIDAFHHEGRKAAAPGAAVEIRTPQGVAGGAKNFNDADNAVHRRVIDGLLRPREWAPTDGFLLSWEDIEDLCNRAEDIFKQEPTVLRLDGPVKIFGDLHGQFGDLMRLFEEYGAPSMTGDIAYIDYLFLGDYVDRGRHSLETVCLLLALKVEHPDHVHLIRGNHEDEDINSLFGFRDECMDRLGSTPGIQAWKRFNDLFNWLPLAAVVAGRICCMHGGIGRVIETMEQIEEIPRPISLKDANQVYTDLLWSDPTTNDAVEGVQPSPRGPGLVCFGPDRVTEFCNRNNLQMIIRAHECVMDGFERFAAGRLITLFSATNYCGTANNAGAILVLGRGNVMVPKLIHPLPPGAKMLTSPDDEFHAYGVSDADTWMQDINDQRPPSPPRGRALGGSGGMSTF